MALMIRRGMPITFYYFLRLATSIPAIVAYAYNDNTSAPVQSWVGMGVITMALCVCVGLSYGYLWRASGIGSPGKANTHPRLWAMRGVGAVDFACTFLVIYLSGGWDSTFWYFALTSLLVPCFYSCAGEALIKASVFVLLYTGILALSGEPMSGFWSGSVFHLYFGFIFSTYLVTVIVSFLGRLYSEAEYQRQQTRAAIFDLGTVIEVTQNTFTSTSGSDDLLEAVTETIGGRHRYRDVAIYLPGDEATSLRLVASTPGYAEEGDDEHLIERGSIVYRAQESLHSAITRSGSSWETAIPIKQQNSAAGVLLLGSEGTVEDMERATDLGNALASEIAVGIANAHLRQQREAAATPDERDRIAQEMRVSISQSAQALFLLLETCLSMARRADPSIVQRLEELVHISSRVTTEMRSYAIELRPIFERSGEITDILRNHAREFEITSGMSVQFKITQHFPSLPDREAVRLYEIFRQILAVIRRDGSASRVDIDLSGSVENILLTISENGSSLSPGSLSGELEFVDLRSAIQDRGGNLEIETAEGSSNRITVALIPRVEVHDLDPINDS